MPAECDATTEQIIVVGDSLTVDFVADTTITCLTPFQVNFTPTTTGDVDDYAWTFGSPATMTPPASTQQNPGTVTYYNSGQYTVCLEVSNEGCTATECKPQYIQIVDPVASFDTVGFDPCIPATVSFESTTDADAVEWVWDFGDGDGTSTDQHPSYTYNDQGCFDVTLVVVSALGCTTTVVRPDIICTNTPPDPEFSWPEDTVCQGQSICVGNTTTGNIDNESWLWEINNTTYPFLLSNPQPCFEITQTGNYNICLSVDNDGCVAEFCIDTFIYVHPVSPLCYQVIRDCDNPMEVSVSITSPPNAFDFISNYWWDFGDGSPDVYSEMTHTHTYTWEDDFTVTLFSNNDTIDCDNGAERNVQVYDPINNFVPSEIELCPGTVQFTDFPVEGVDSLGWMFTDTSSIVWMDPFYAQLGGVEHTYADTGWYSVTLILAIRGITACYDTLTMPNLIHVIGEGLDGSFIFQPVEFCDNEHYGIQFNGLPPTGVVSWNWDFDNDGNYDSFVQNPLHYFSNWTGGTLIGLYIEDSDGCSSTLVEWINYVPAPDVEIDVSASLACQDSAVAFTADPLLYLELDHYEWNFGDGNTATGIDPTVWHSYEDNDQYTVTLITESQNGCRDTTVVVAAVTVDNPVASFTAEVGYDFCPSVFLTFINTSSGTLTDYILDFGDDTALEEPYAQPPGSVGHIYGGLDVYDATLIATNAAGCTDTATSLNVLNPFDALGPISILSEDTANCPPFDIQLGAYNQNDTCYTYNWTFGDGGPTLAKGGTVVDYVYTSAGTFMVTLIMINCINNQCSYTDSVEITVAPLTVNAWTDTTICQGDSTLLHATVMASGVVNGNYAYQWNNELWLTDSSLSDPLAFPQNTTQFVVTGNYSDCYATDSVNVTINQLPVITQSPIAAVCDDAAPFSLSGATPLGGFYSGLNVTPVDMFNPGSASPGCDTIYYHFTDNNGCENIDTCCITVHPLPTVEFAHIDSLCNDASLYVFSEGKSGRRNVWWRRRSRQRFLFRFRCSRTPISSLTLSAT